MRVRHYMTRQVATVHPDSPLDAVRELMESRRIRHVPVVDDERRLVGLICHRDLLGRMLDDLLASSTSSMAGSTGPLVRDVMRTGMATVDPDLDAREAAWRLTREENGCLLVVDDHVLAGILTDFDLLAVVEGLLANESEATTASSTATDTANV